MKPHDWELLAIKLLGKNEVPRHKKFVNRIKWIIEMHRPKIEAK